MLTNVVLLHDWLTGFRGGERVLESFCDVFPSAPIYTLVHVKDSTSPTIESRKIHTSFLNGFPNVEKNYRKFLPLMPAAADRLKIEGPADVILSSSHCVIKGVRKPPGSVHVSYVHSPMRYMYDQYNQYFGPQASLPIRLGAKMFRNYLTNWDKGSNRNVDLMIANSHFVKERIRKYYGFESEVVHPFVELSDFEAVQKNPPVKQDYYVMVTAFAPNKRVDLAVEAFNKNKRRLIIIGGGQLEKELRMMAGPNIEFAGSLSRAGVIDTLSKARALVFPGVEDFGIVPLEALAAGTPVIAYRAGGVLETLTETDSVFFEEPSVSALNAAIEESEKKSFNIDRKRLETFSKKRFQSDILYWVEQAKSGRRTH